jgi:WD40 repeat protein
MDFPKLAIDSGGRFVVVPGSSSVFVVPLDGGTSRKLDGFSPAVANLSVALGPNGRLIAAAPMRGPVKEKVIRIWDLESGESWTLGPLESAGDGVQGGFVGLGFLPEGRLLSSGYDNGLHLWSLTQGHLRSFSSGWGKIAVSRDGRFVLRSEADSENQLVRFDIETGVFSVLHSHGNDVYRPAFDPSGRLALSTTHDGNIVQVGPVTGEEPHILFTHEVNVRSVAVSPDGRFIASSGEDGTIRLTPMPDMDEPPFHTLPHEELLKRLGAVTNVRVVEDESSSTGYRLDFVPFPGWEKVPTW